MRKYIASKEFYVKTGKMMIPITIQSIINSLSGLIDTMMSSRIDAVSGVGTALQIDALMQGIAFGIAAGINIFIVQYYGAKDYKNMKKCFGLSLIVVSINAILWMILSLGFHTHLLSLFINDSFVVEQAFDYLKFSCFSFVFTSMTLSFTFAYHSVQKTYIPLIISIVVTIFHCFMNILLMFNLDLGVQGAGISMTLTQILNFILFLSYSLYSHQPFIGKVKEMFMIPFSLIKKVYQKVYPLVINETLFSIGNSLFVVAYGVLGKNVMDCYYIGNQIVNLFYTIVNAMSDAATSMIGLELGQENYDYAQKEVNYFFGMTTILSIIVIINILIFAPNIASMFEISSPELFDLSVAIIRVLSIRIAFRLFNVIIFASLRAGGDSKYLTFIDSVILWTVGLTMTFFMVYVLQIKDIVFIIFIGQFEQLVRLVLGIRRMGTKKWINNMV